MMDQIVDQIGLYDQMEDKITQMVDWIVYQMELDNIGGELDSRLDGNYIWGLDSRLDGDQITQIIDQIVDQMGDKMLQIMDQIVNQMGIIYGGIR